MNREGSDLDPELEAFLEHHRIRRHVPTDMRLRVLARARATVAGRKVVPVRLLEPASRSLARGRRAFRVAVAASIVVGGLTIGAVAALRGRSPTTIPAASADSESLREPRSAVGGPSVPSAEPPARAPEEHGLPVRSPRPVRPAAKGDPFMVELELLQHAHDAYTRREFPAALALLAAHARRFPSGRLAEQREAMRVRSLAGAGRGQEARRAAAAFAVRFPRSVLLSRGETDWESSEP